MVIVLDVYRKGARERLCCVSGAVQMKSVNKSYHHIEESILSLHGRKYLTQWLWCIGSTNVIFHIGPVPAISKYGPLPCAVRRKPVVKI